LEVKPLVETRDSPFPEGVPTANILTTVQS